MAKVDIEKIDEIYEWYYHTGEWLRAYSAEVIRLARNRIFNSPLICDELLFKNPSEIQNSLILKLDRLSMVSVFQLFVSFEGSIRYDTDKRQRRPRVGKDLKKLVRGKNARNVKISKIIDCWCDYYSINKNDFAILKGLSDYRNWLAHGRYWDNVKIPAKLSAITPDYVFIQMRSCFDEFKKYESDFEW